MKPKIKEIEPVKTDDNASMPNQAAGQTSTKKKNTMSKRELRKLKQAQENRKLEISGERAGQEFGSHEGEDVQLDRLVKWYDSTQGCASAIDDIDYISKLMEGYYETNKCYDDNVVHDIFYDSIKDILWMEYEDDINEPIWVTAFVVNAVKAYKVKTAKYLEQRRLQEQSRLARN